MFAKIKSEGQLAPMRQQRRGGAFSVLGADVVVAGDIVTTDSLQINGTIRGDIRCGTFHQGASGTVTGSIVADEARLAGLVEGTVTARLLILEPSARITGDVAYETLTIESGARVQGRFTHSEGNAGTVTPLFPAADAVVAAE